MGRVLVVAGEGEGRQSAPLIAYALGFEEAASSTSVTLFW